MSAEGSGAPPADVELTPLRPGDVPALAAIHQRAFAGFFLAQLGEGFLREFYRGFVSDPSAVAVVARTPDGPVGAVVGTLQPESFYGRLLRRRWHGFALAAAGAALRRPRTIPRLLRAVRYRGDSPVGLADAALLASLCVDPSHAGVGVGGRLTRAWAERAAELGARRAYLATDRDDNEGVNRHYQRHGWRLESTYTTPEGRRMNRYVTQLADRPADAGTPTSGDQGAS